MYLNGDGKDTIYSSNWGGSDDNDVFYLAGTSASYTRTSDGLTFTMKNDSDKVTLTGDSNWTADTALKVTTNGKTITTMKVGMTSDANTLTYESGVNAYFGGKGGDTLKATEDANIWLNGSQGVTYSSIEVVDATSSSGNVIIAGSSGNETLMGGSGTNAIWGGAGNDELSNGSGGATQFLWGYGDGTDTITQASSDDKVVLYNVKKNNFAGAALDSSGNMVISTTDGSKLVLQKSGASGMTDVTFSAWDTGSVTLSYDWNSDKWSAK